MKKILLSLCVTLVPFGSAAHAEFIDRGAGPAAPMVDVCVGIASPPAIQTSAPPAAASVAVANPSIVINTALVPPRVNHHFHNCLPLAK